MELVSSVVADLDSAACVFVPLHPPTQKLQTTKPDSYTHPHGQHGINAI